MTGITIKDDVLHSHKVLNFFGLKLKFRKNMKKVYERTHSNYKRVIKRIKEKSKNEKIKVIFLVSELEKWNGQQLYEAFDFNPDFEPIILVTVLAGIHYGYSLKKNRTEEIYNFFKNKNMKVDYAYRDGKYVDLQDFNPDIVFHQQPWQIEDIQSPEAVSKYALCCYISYGISESKQTANLCKSFFCSIWKYFLTHECLKEDYLKLLKYNKESLCVTGNPKLDFYKQANIVKQEESRHYVIYAPHHSVKDSILKFATFDWSGYFMLEYAKKHPDINWLFKPHPNLKAHFIKTGYMSEEKIDQYFEEWAKVGEVCTSGDYFSVFTDSEAMITDCSAFLIEYSFTGKPLIHMISSNSEKHSSIDRIVSENYYIVKNKETLEKYLDEILIKKNDFLKEVRVNNIKKIFNSCKLSSDNIIEFLEKTLIVKNVKN